MKNLKPKLIALCLIIPFWVFCCATSMQAQETVTSSGGEATGSGVTVSYTLVQLFYTTHSGTNGSVAEGVQQTYEISVVTGLDETEVINLECTVYPNPTSDFLVLKIDASSTLSIRSMEYQLYDMNGQLLESKYPTANETTIDMAKLLPGIYFLKVIDNSTDAKPCVSTFKIIKN